MSEDSALDFFNQLAGTLEMETDVPPERISPQLDNLKAPGGAKILALRFKPQVFLREEGAFRDLTAAELARVALRQSAVTLVGEADVPVQHAAPNGAFFTVEQLIRAVEETERQTRGQSSWFGGADLHHRFFEGIRQRPDGSWRIDWGS